jgi:hypothetical protein
MKIHKRILGTSTGLGYGLERSTLSSTWQSNVGRKNCQNIPVCFIRAGQLDLTACQGGSEQQQGNLWPSPYYVTLEHFPRQVRKV